VQTIRNRSMREQVDRMMMMMMMMMGMDMMAAVSRVRRRDSR